MVAVALDEAPLLGKLEVKGQNYYLPAQLARHVWRLSCTYDEMLPKGCSESALMEVAWRLLLEQNAQETFGVLSRCFSRRGIPVETERKCYALPPALLAKIEERYREVKSIGRDRNAKVSRSQLAEAAQILLVELPPAKRDKLVLSSGVRKRRA